MDEELVFSAVMGIGIIGPLVGVIAGIEYGSVTMGLYWMFGTIFGAIAFVLWAAVLAVIAGFLARTF